MKQVETIEIGPDEGEVRLDRWFRRRFPHVTQGQIEKLLRTGQIRVDGARAKAADRLCAGQIIRVPPLPDAETKPVHEGPSEKDIAFARSLVIYRDADVIALNKPHGLAVQGGTKTARHLDQLLDGLTFEYRERPKLVHRLDRDTSGVLLLARNPRAAAMLSRAFKTRETRKLYWAIVLGAPKPPEGEVRGWMKKAPGARDGDRELVRAAAHGEEGAQFAITDYATISTAGKATWMALKPVTGRTHQLRFHMAELGCAIVGDPKYKCDLPTPGGLDAKLHLHARALECPHPNGSTLSLVAPIPAHMKRTFDALGFDERDGRRPFEPFEA